MARQCTSALAYLHSHGLKHTYLMPWVWQVYGDGDNAHVQLSDYGVIADISILYDENPHGLPPEIVNAIPDSDVVIDERGDVWSLGTLIYFLLVRRHPFSAGSNDLIYAKIGTCEYQCDGDEWVVISDAAKDLIRHMLVLEPAKRITAAQALQHPWFTGNC